MATPEEPNLIRDGIMESEAWHTSSNIGLSSQSGTMLYPPRPEIYDNGQAVSMKGVGTFVISAESGGYDNGDFAKIMINNVPVEMQKNENDNFRGLHMVVINNENGHIETNQVFDTYDSSDKLDAFIEKEIPDGHIIIAACKDDMCTKLSDKAKSWFKGIGMYMIHTLGYR